MRAKGIIIGSCLLIILIIALLAASCGNSRSTRTSVSAAMATVPVARTLPPLPVRKLSPKLEAMRARTLNTAASLRELQPQGETGMTELSAWEYGKRTGEMAEVLGGEELRALGRLAAAGGVLPEGTDLATLAASFAALSASATYSPLDKQVLMVKTATGDSLLTHEFVHALQDQHFDLLKLLVVRPYNFDRTEAVFAVVEGDAMNVQRRAEEGDAYARKSLEEISRQETVRFGEYRKEMAQLFPPLLTETFVFRYRDGARFVETVRRRGGERAVDELFRRPPVSSEQILHAEKYLSNETPREVVLNEEVFGEHGWRAVASTPLGEIGARGLLMARVGEQEAVRAAAGWGGDRAFLFERTGGGGTPLFIWKTVWDRPLDAEEFFRAYASQKLERGADAAQVSWREDGRTTLVRRDGDALIVIRGAESDVETALELARR